jgi:hypothetical protein
MIYINRDKLNCRLPYHIDLDGDALISLNTVRRLIAMTPAEDVVPRARITEFLEALGNCLAEVVGHPGIYTISESDLHELRLRFLEVPDEKDT